MILELVKVIRARPLSVAALAVVAAGGIALYASTRGGGNVLLAAQDCSGAAATAESLEPSIRGAIAAFNVGGERDSMAGLAFKTPDATDTDIGDFAGKTVLLNLWATWCGPCRAEMPALDRLQAELGGDDFEVVAVNIDTGSPERAVDFLEETGVENLAFYNDSSTAIFNDLKRRGLALGLPVTQLIDANGCRIGGMQGPAEWDSEDAIGLIRAALET